MPKILLLAIDDKQDNLLVLKALLKNFIPEATLVTALSGREGLVKSVEEQPDTIILDVKMPEMDGYEVCRRLRSDRKTMHIPVIMLTAVQTDSKSKARGLEAGADAFLTKPVDEIELVAQIKAMLRIKRSEDLLRHEKKSLEIIAERCLSRARLYLDIAGVMFIALDSSGKITLINKRGCELLQTSEAEALGRNWFDSYLPERIVNEVKAVFQQLMTGNIDPVEYHENTVLTGNGNELILAFHSTILTDEKEKITGILFSAEDITERRRAEEELENHRQHLEKRVRERTEELQSFVNAMAGREVRMVELKMENRKLRDQLKKAGIIPPDNK